MLNPTWGSTDYKTDPIRNDQALSQAAHHAPQLQLRGRALALAAGLKVRERLVVFTAATLTGLLDISSPSADTAGARTRRCHGSRCRAGRR